MKNQLSEEEIAVILDVLKEEIKDLENKGNFDEAFKYKTIISKLTDKK